MAAYDKAVVAHKLSFDGSEQVTAVLEPYQPYPGACGRDPRRTSASRLARLRGLAAL